MIGSSFNEYSRLLLLSRCMNDEVLRKVNLSSAKIETLISLLNEKNKVDLQTTPILIAKAITKQTMRVVDQAIFKGQVKQYLNYDNIPIRVEDDELLCLQNKEQKRKPNIIFVTTKNIIFAMVSDQLTMLRNGIINPENGDNFKDNDFNMFDLHEPSPTTKQTKEKTPTFVAPRTFNANVEGFNRSESRASQKSTTVNITISDNAVPKTSMDPSTTNPTDTIDSNLQSRLTEERPTDFVSIVDITDQSDSDDDNNTIKSFRNSEINQNNTDDIDNDNASIHENSTTDSAFINMNTDQIEPHDLEKLNNSMMHNDLSESAIHSNTIDSILNNLNGANDNKYKNGLNEPAAILPPPSPKPPSPSIRSLPSPSPSPEPQSHTNNDAIETVASNPFGNVSVEELMDFVKPNIEEQKNRHESHQDIQTLNSYAKLNATNSNMEAITASIIPPSPPRPAKRHRKRAGSPLYSGSGGSSSGDDDENNYDLIDNVHYYKNKQAKISSKRPTFNRNTRINKLLGNN